MTKFAKLRSALSVAIILCLCGGATAQQAISIQGSDSLIYMGQRLAEIYQNKSSGSSIRIGGGGVDHAVNALASRQADVAQFEGSRSNLETQDLVTLPVGVQTIVVYINSSNPVRNLTVAQLQSIFLGKITNWKNVGGPDLEIHLYAGESSTGTLSYFQDYVLNGEEPYPFVGKSNTKGLLEEIAAHRDAIGYGSLDSASGVRAVAIQAGPHTVPVEPTSDSIRARRYPLTRYITWATSRKNSDKLKPLVTWVLGSEGQLVVESVGFEPLLPADRQANLAKFSGERVWPWSKLLVK